MVIFLLYAAITIFIITSFFFWRIIYKTNDTLLVLGVIKIIFGVYATFLITNMAPMNVSQKECSDNHISYELVQTTAEFTDKTEKEVLDFFIIMSNAEVDSFDAVSYLAPELTDDEVLSIITAADMKQKKAGN